MFQTWRLKLREAEEALRHARLDEAGRLVSQDELRQYLPGQQLAAKVAKAIAERARQRVAAGDMAAGWRDLETATALAGETNDLLAARHELVARALAEVESYLAADDPSGALLRMEQLERQKISGDQLRALKQIARWVESARTLCRRGKFAEAESQFASAAALRPDLAILEDRRAACHERLVKSRDLTDQMHRALAAFDWSKALSVADELLEMAPEFRPAIDARKRAWAEVGAKGDETHYVTRPAARRGLGAAAAELQPGGVALAEEPEQASDRFLLWVDAVGGYLVCLGNEVVIGQAAPGNKIDLPLKGDLSRRHAIIRRDGENYLLDPLDEVHIEGRLVSSATHLSDGDELEFGSSVKLRFRKPHVLSASARLEFVSRHRTQPYADGILLMAESCVLGPKWHNHVVCRDWTDDVVLYRHDHELYCRSMRPLEIDGQIIDGRGRITRSSHISSEDFSLSLEELP